MFPVAISCFAISLHSVHEGEEKQQLPTVLDLKAFNDIAYI